MSQLTLKVVMEYFLEKKLRKLLIEFGFRKPKLSLDCWFLYIMETKEEKRKRAGLQFTMLVPV